MSAQIETSATNRSINYQQIKYGYLYNYYACTDVREITSIGWTIPTATEWNTMLEYIDDEGVVGEWENVYPVAGSLLKSVGSQYWGIGNTDGIDEYNFRAVGGGYREYEGTFMYGPTDDPDNICGFYATKTTYNPTSYVYFEIDATYEFVFNSVDELFWLGKTAGSAIRLIRNATTEEQLLDDGDYVADYVGNDTRRYKAIKIGTQIWTCENLAETKYRNGDTIPEVTDGTTWSGLSTGARCSYNNTSSYIPPIV